VEVKMIDGLAPVPTDIRDDAVARLQALIARDRSQEFEHLRYQRPILRRQLSYRRDVLLGDHQDVGRRLRSDVSKRKDIPGFGHDIGIDLARRDLAKETIVGHD
jgi:hypothetical protein